MEGKRAWKFCTSFLLTALISQSLVSLVRCRILEEFANQKNYYAPDPHLPLPPTHAHSPPRHHRTPACPPPPHGGSGCSCGPSHGGGPGTSTPPSHGGYYNNPPPSPTVEPVYPAPTIPINPPSPSPPLVPVEPGTPPLNPGGSPPFIPVDPNTPGTCPYWSTHPTLIWGIFGYWATIGGLFGPVTTLPFGASLSVQDALENTRTDGFGELYREGTASLLNSMVDKKFPFSTTEVKHAFTSSLVSEKAAAAQARIFKSANEGRLKKH